MTGGLCKKCFEKQCIIDKQSEEIVALKAKKVLHRLCGKMCTKCHKVFRAKAPSVMPKALYGNQLVTNVAVMNVLHGTPLGRLEEVLGIRAYQDIFRENKHRLYHWVKNRRVPADNNRAERDLRPTVIARKVSFGSQSEAGAKTRGILMSVLVSLKKRAVLKPSTSLSFENGAFYTAGNALIQDALFTFHMHATHVDDSVYAGPSGMSGFTELGGDYGHAQETGMPGMVITACGTDASGHLNLDYDIYYVHVPEREAGEAVHVKFRGIPVIVGSGLRHSTNTYIGLDDGQPKDTPAPNNNGNNIKLSNL